MLLNYIGYLIFVCYKINFMKNFIMKELVMHVTLCIFTNGGHIFCQRERETLNE